MSTCYYVTTVSVRGAGITLRLEAVQPDSSVFYLNKGFALQVVSEGAELGDPLYDALAEDDLSEPDEMEANADRFIESVDVVHHDPTWNDHGKLPEATYRIVVTDPRWAAHLRPGERFDSVAWVEDENVDCLSNAAAPTP